MKGKRQSYHGFLFLGLVLFCLGALGCGRYAAPRAPEYYSPGPVGEVSATASVDGVTIEWSAPEKTRSGKDLKEIDGYVILRRVDSGETGTMHAKKSKPPEYEELALIEDRHLVILDSMKKEARAQGKPARNLKVDSKLTKFSYTDTDVKPGFTYHYTVVGVNQGGTKGTSEKVFRVKFSGEASEVISFDADSEDEI